MSTTHKRPPWLPTKPERHVAQYFSAPHGRPGTSDIDTLVCSRWACLRSVDTRLWVQTAWSVSMQTAGSFFIVSISFRWDIYRDKGRSMLRPCDPMNVTGSNSFANLRRPQVLPSQLSNADLTPKLRLLRELCVDPTTRSSTCILIPVHSLPFSLMLQSFVESKTCI